MVVAWLVRARSFPKSPLKSMAGFRKPQVSRRPIGRHPPETWQPWQPLADTPQPVGNLKKERHRMILRNPKVANLQALATFWHPLANDIALRENNVALRGDFDPSISNGFRARNVTSVTELADGLARSGERSRPLRHNLPGIPPSPGGCSARSATRTWQQHASNTLPHFIDVASRLPRASPM
jgi:hypothetical protein